MHFTIIPTAILLAASAVSAFTVPREEPSKPSSGNVDLDVADDYSSLLAYNLISALALHQQQAGEEDAGLSTLSARDLDDIEIDEDLLELLLDNEAIAALAARSLPDTSPAHALIARDPGFMDSIRKKAKAAGKAIKDFAHDTKELIQDAADGLIGKCNIAKCGKALGPATVSCLKAAKNRGANIAADLSCIQKVR